MGNQSRFVARDFTGRGPFDLINPFAANRFSIARRRDEVERSNRNDGLHFGLHCGLPLIVVDGLNGFFVGVWILTSSKEGGGLSKIALLGFEFIMHTCFIVFVGQVAIGFESIGVVCSLGWQRLRLGVVLYALGGS